MTRYLSKAILMCRMHRLSAFGFSVSKDVIELTGVVEEAYPNAMFRVKVTSDPIPGHQLLCSLAGRMRVHRVKILPGDRVKLEMTPYDTEKGRIVYRFSAGNPGPQASAPAPVAAPAPDSPSPSPSAS